MTLMMSRLILLVSFLTISGCWETQNKIYDGTDYYAPVQSEIVTIHDEFGPLGIYSINSKNQYVPLLTEAKPNEFEQKFRLFNIGFVPVDRMATYKEPRANWRTNPAFSKSLFQDQETLLFVSTLEKNAQASQTIFASYVSGDVVGICSTLLHEGKGLHNEFLGFAAMEDPELAFTKKAGIAMLVLSEATEAKAQDNFQCNEYQIEGHEGESKAALFEAAERGDKLRKAAKERRNEKVRADAVKLAEASPARDADQQVPTTSEKELTPQEQLAALHERLSDLQREVYEVNNQIDGERWGTVNGVGGQYYGVDRSFRDRGLMFQSQMLCHNFSGYESIYLTVTHASSVQSNPSWVMRGETVPLRIETERGVINHNAALEVVGNTRYTNKLRVIFADLVASKIDNKYVRDPVLLEKTRRQAKFFGMSVEALTRMSYDFLSLENARNSETMKVYASVRQNGKVRTVFLGDFGSAAHDGGLEGFHSACLFEP